MPLAARPREPSNRLLLGLQRATRRRRSGRPRPRACWARCPPSRRRRPAGRSVLPGRLPPAWDWARARAFPRCPARSSQPPRRKERARAPASALATSESSAGLAAAAHLVVVGAAAHAAFVLGAAGQAAFLAGAALAVLLEIRHHVLLPGVGDRSVSRSGNRKTS